MNHSYGEDQDRVTVTGFNVPNSPDSSYNNVYPGNEDEGREPPSLPPHLQHTVLNHPTTNIDPRAALPTPQNVTLNHLYIENRETPGSVVALGVTHRFRSKYVTVVLYKPVQRRDRFGEQKEQRRRWNNLIERVSACHNHDPHWEAWTGKEVDPSSTL